MTDRPTNRFNRPPAGRADSEDARTQRAHWQSAPAAMPTSQIRGDNSSAPTQASALAWSQDAREESHNPEYYGAPGGYSPNEYQPYPPQDHPHSASAHDSDTDAPPRGFWLRSAPTYLLAGAAVAILAAGGGLAYTLTGSKHENPAPAHQSVAPQVPQQNNGVAPAPQVSPAVPVQSPEPAPDAPIPAPVDDSGPAPVAPPLVVPQAPAPQPQPNTAQQPDANQQQQQLPNNQQQQLPNNQQQLPNNQQQLPNNQQQQQPNNQQQLPNNQQQQLPKNQQQQQPAQKQESPNDTLCHPKAPPC